MRGISTTLSAILLTVIALALVFYFWYIILPSNTGGEGRSTFLAPWPMFHRDLNHSGYLPPSQGVGAGPDVDLLWSFHTDYAVESSPAIADIDGDGKLEIIVGSDDGKVYAINNDGTLLWSFTTGDRVRSSPAIADIDGDGKLEIIVGSDDGKVYAINNDGTKLWSFTIGRWVSSSPSIADIDGDGKLEIVIGSFDGRMYVLDTLPV